MIVSLKILKKLGAKKIFVYGDFELVSKQVKGEYQAKNRRIQADRNVVLNILNTFTKYTFPLISTDKNVIFDFLTTSTSMFKIPLYPNKKYEINVKNFPDVPDNFQYWKVF